jgi:hypothetical protein
VHVAFADGPRALFHGPVGELAKRTEDAAEIDAAAE